MGIGTATPTARLDVTGNIKIADGTQGAGKVLTSDAAGLANWQPVPLETDPRVGNLSVNKTPKWNGTTLTDGSITDNGNVGIGTTTPSAKLEVAGNIKITDGTQGLGKVLVSDATGLATWSTPPVIPWTINGSNIFNSNAGNVGIGTTTPTAKLDVTGNIKIANGTQGAGKVLTSDANGLSSWQAVPIVAETDGKWLFSKHKGQLLYFYLQIDY